MKKLILIGLLAAFAVGCTQNSIQEDDYENGIQLIDKDAVKPPSQNDRIEKDEIENGSMDNG